MTATAPQQTAVAAAPEAPSPRATRDAYRDLMAQLLAREEKWVCLDSDTGLFNGVDFEDAARRYVNLGIAEQNLMGAAAGLARDGWVPFVNTMATFASSRAVESVKIDIALNNLPVRIVATHAGLAAGHLGSTHHCLEDLAVMRLLPNMTVLVPADAASTEELIRQSAAIPGPVYVRLGRKATAPVPETEAPVRLGHAQVLAEGGDVVLVACGPHPVLMALEAAGELAAHGIGATVLNMHTIKPFDSRTLLAAAHGARGVVTVEEHWRSGGLGSLVAETLADSDRPLGVRRIGVDDRFVSGNGNQDYLLDQAGITPGAVVDAARRFFRQGR